jgi:uncharacterized protein HemX
MIGEIIRSIFQSNKDQKEYYNIRVELADLKAKVNDIKRLLRTEDIDRVLLVKKLEALQNKIDTISRSIN